MTTGTLSDDMIMQGRIYPDQRSFTTATMNQCLSTHRNVLSRTTFYAQWALANSGHYTGPIDGVVGPTSALFDAFVSLYDSAYSGPDYQRPANNAVSFKFYKAVIFDESSVDPNVYKVVS